MKKTRLTKDEWKRGYTQEEIDSIEMWGRVIHKIILFICILVSGLIIMSLAHKVT